jgi:hypothetical protein
MNNLNKNKKSTNKDVNRNKKHIKKIKHLKSVEKSKNKAIKKKEKEKYMRRERDYNKYFMKNKIQHDYMYKIKDFIVEWFNTKADINDDDFWSTIIANDNSEFIFKDRKHYNILTTTEEYLDTGKYQYKYYSTILSNENFAPLDAVITEKIFDDIPEAYYTWINACESGSKHVLRILEDNVEKYREKYGHFYKLLYYYICLNDNCINFVNKYHPIMFEFDINKYPIGPFYDFYQASDYDYMYALSHSRNKEVLKLIEPYLNYIENENRFNSTYHSIINNPSAISLIEQFSDFDCYNLCYNKNAVHLIQKLYGNNFENLTDDYWWYNLSEIPNAIPMVEKHISENKGLVKGYRNLASNPEGIDLFERLYNDNKIWYFENDPRYNINNEYVSSDCKTKNIHPLSFHEREKIIEHLLWNPGAIGFLERNQQFLGPDILINKAIFEINYDYLRKKTDYVSYDEEEKIIKYTKNELNTIEPRLLKKINSPDYITLREIDKVIEDYKKKDKYLSERELMFRISEKRLINAVFSPHRVLLNLQLYNYNIGTEEYWTDDETL